MIAARIIHDNPFMPFPKGFYWGAATAAHQVEGNNTNDWSEWEKKNAGRLAREAKGKFGYLPNWKEIQFEAEDPNNYLSGTAAEHWERYQEDFDILKDLGLNAYRFSIEWSRIEPEEGKFDEAAIEHYRQVLQSLRKKNIEPFVTLWHWTNPVWIAEKGGWENRDTIRYFLRYADRVALEYKDLVKFWMPLNEPGTFIGMGYVQGAFPPQKRLALFTANRVFKNLMRAYRQSYRIIHEHAPDALVGLSHYAACTLPYENKPWNKVLAKIIDYVRNWRFLDSIDDTNDFIGIQFYHTDHIKLTPLWNGRWGLIDVKNPNTWTTDMGWDVYPEGLYHILKRAARYGKPIYITENGIADQFDRQRTRFIEAHVAQIERAISERVDVRGYLHWSLLDNFEWDKGYWPRFGLVAVDRATQTRTVRESARKYAELVAKYRAEVK